MFVLTFGKNGLRRLGTVAVCGVALAGAVFAVGSFFMEDDAAPAAANGETAQADPTAMKIEGTDDIQAFFKAFGLEVDLATATVDKVKIPKNWDESFSAFNTVVKESGLSLEKYKNKTVEKWVVLCPGRSTGENKVSGVLLVYKEEPVGAYLLASPSGEVTGLVSAAATAAPLTDEQAAETAAGFGEDAASAAAPAAAADLPEVSPAPLPAALSGRLCMAKGENGWFAVQGGNVWTVENAALPALLEGEAELWVFDAKPLYRIALEAGGEGKAIRFDAKLAAYLLNPAASDYQAQQLEAEYAPAPRFACPDLPAAGALEGLYDALAAKVEEQGMTGLLQDIELPLARVLADMERIGMPVDKDGLEAFGTLLKAELDKTLASIYEAVGYTFNLNSPKQLAEALFDKMGLPPRKKTKSGYSTDAETLESLRSYSPVVEDILQYRTYQKLNSTYVEGLLKVIGPDGRMHSTFNQTEARTGRLSSSEPNLQNIPIRTKLGSRLRQFFIASPGCKLVDADYSQIELRILAHISGDETMKNAFLTGQDIHRSTAAKIYGLPPEMVTPALRSSAKAVNFGIVYGIGAFSLARDIGVTVKEADDFIKNYLATFPGVKEYMDSTIAAGRENGYVTTLFGRRRALPELASKNFNLRSLGERMAMNTPIQGTAADVIKLAMVRVWRRLRDEGLAARLILQVHDELIVEAPAAEVRQVSRILKEEMEGAVNFTVPLTADVSSGDTWLEAH